MDHYPLLLPLLIGSTLVFLIGAFVLTALNSSLRQIFKREPKKNIRTLSPSFFYRFLHIRFFALKEFEELFFSVSCTQNVVRFCYISSFVVFFVLINPHSLHWTLTLFLLLVFIIVTFFIGDLIPRILGIRYPEKTLLICGPIASIFMLPVFPLSYLLLKIARGVPRAAYFDDLQESVGKQEILDIIQDANVSRFDAHEKKLIESVVTFRDRIAREVMVPRVNLFSLSAETSIREAANLLKAEGYSRTPVYRQNIDNIIGVLMYKDLLSAYIEYEKTGNAKCLNTPIETIVKGVLYTPETKKISHLLQEFRKRQVHLAIVVDEYGGTEGIVTIEDILEEIVGEIADEYDEKEALYVHLPDGSWLVDARMSIFDAEELLNVEFPQDGEYDTIGGYIFHRTGSILPKGSVIHHDSFDLEIVNSNDRFVEKVKIKPLQK